MSISAVLGIPVVVLYGNTNQRQWRPLNVPHEIIQKPSMGVKDISADEAFAAFKKPNKHLTDNHKQSIKARTISNEASSPL